MISDILLFLTSSSGNKYPSSWTSAAVKELFEGKSNTPSTTTSLTTANLTAPNSTGQLSSSNSSVSTSPSGLSHGAVAGIAVGCTAAFVLSAVGATFMVKHWSNRTRAIDAPNETAPVYYSQPPLEELPAEPRVQEILNSYQDRTELPHRGRRHLIETSTSEPTIPELSVENSRSDE